MTVIVTGAKGQLGRALKATQPSHIDTVFLDRTGLDLSNTDSIVSVLEKIQPSAIVNTAAYTAVDQAESDRKTADEVNHLAAAVLARYAQSAGIPLIHVSTDYVFNGLGSSPYRPDAAIEPLGVYGQTKALGEQQVRALCPGSTIVRTAWVYYEGGKNFVNTMLRLAESHREIKVVADQIGAPTYAGNLAACLWALLTSAESRGLTLHYTDAGVASWYDFAQAVFTLAETTGIVKQRPAVLPIRTEQYPTPASRPAYSVLDCQQTYAIDRVPRVYWRDALADMLKRQQALTGGAQ